MASSSASALAILIGVAAAVAIQGFWMPTDSDVSWLITVSERVLAGDRLYVDILEVNPPASVWMYLPFVWVAHVLAAKAEAVVVAAFLVGSVVSVLSTLRLVSRLDDGPPPLWLASALAFVTMVLPMTMFAEREHAAMLLALPALAAVAVLAEGKSLSRRVLTACGTAAGFIIVIKPPFLFVIAGPALWAALKRRSLKPLALPAAAATLTALLYGLAVLALAPAYFELLPMIARTYVPMHNAIWKVIVVPALFPAICLASAFLLRPSRMPSLAIAWAAGSAGFVVAAILQAKSYPNHWLPGTGLAVLALVVVLAETAVDQARRIAVGCALAAVVAGAMYQWSIRPDPAIAAAVVRVAPSNPSIIALSPNLGTGHPLTRNVGGRWVGSRAGLFTAAGARFVGLGDPVSRGYYLHDLDSFASDVARNRPDVVLVDRSSKTWLMGERVINRAMESYRPAAVVGDTEVWLREGAAKRKAG